MATAPAPTEAPDTDTGDGDDDLVHTFCWCNKDISLCGRNLTGCEMLESWDQADVPCVVCYDLKDTPCSRCGGLP